MTKLSFHRNLVVTFFVSLKSITCTLHFPEVRRLFVYLEWLTSVRE